MSTFALWDTDTNNMVATYANFTDALDLVLDAMERNGPKDVETLLLDVVLDNGSVVVIAEGTLLGNLARSIRRPRDDRSQRRQLLMRRLKRQRQASRSHNAHLAS